MITYTHFLFLLMNFKYFLIVLWKMFNSYARKSDYLACIIQ